MNEDKRAYEIINFKDADTLTSSLFDVSKDMLSGLGPGELWPQQAALSFTVGIY
ncbi:hypothetical protein CNO13_08000 (plasmid) [Borrelia miyamotoi]|uniref:Uncharacterized protein n=2 Tax=Borrelia miyamotoi TaxID=47466 RepID=A0AAQ3HG02_9SPIR|nr:hypothetical protein [Borrelia miyamotoi]AHH05995.1 Putative membrane spanning protein [Borrelia miyamotoi FR64b]WCB91113.1 hypothetical protein CNO11_07645 [Borrelia miyamotoi]WCL22225.1 hypothetical protein CNO10_07570 [Borrelia miyamotoi]WDE70469.1 hypothetical protein CNO12_07670 [Borrelia miyamotoi]WDE71964.1 hypothetical protein CNO13_08000 [Borrelia miyamotoi]